MRAQAFLNYTLEDLVGWVSLREFTFRQEKVQLDVTDFEKAVESAASLKRLDLRPLEIPGKKPRGMFVDKTTQDKLKKHAEKNGHLEFICWNENGSEIVVK